MENHKNNSIQSTVSSYCLASSLTVSPLVVLPLTTKIPLIFPTQFRTNTDLLISDLLGVCTFFLFEQTQAMLESEQSLVRCTEVDLSVGRFILPLEFQWLPLENSK